MQLVCFLFLAALVQAEIDVRLLNPSEKAGKKVSFKFESDAAELTLKSMKTNAGDDVFSNLVRTAP